jgi:pyochelin synthetase
LLPTDQVGRSQSFFELGGDSLLAAQLATEIRQAVPQAAGIFYDDLLRMILDNTTVAALAEQLSVRQFSPRADTAGGNGGSSPRADTTSPVVHLADGAGRDLTLLVHDGTGALAAYGSLAQEPLDGTALDGTALDGTALAGLVVRDEAAYLETSPDTLIDLAAAGYVQALCAEGWDRVQVIGHGAGSVLAAEVARQLLENGVLVRRLVIIDPVVDGPVVGTEPDGSEGSAVFRHSVAAAQAHELLPFAGDITLVTSAGEAAADVTYWQDACLGDVDIVEFDGGPDGPLLSAPLALAALLSGVTSDG